MSGDKKVPGRPKTRDRDFKLRSKKRLPPHDTKEAENDSKGLDLGIKGENINDVSFTT